MEVAAAIYFVIGLLMAFVLAGFYAPDWKGDRTQKAGIVLVVLAFFLFWPAGIALLVGLGIRDQADKLEKKRREHEENVEKIRAELNKWRKE